MKKQLSLALLCATAMILTSCEEPYSEEITEPAATVSDGSAVGKTKKFTFTLKGDFSNDWKPVGTRGYLEADGKAMTDVWVLDYQDGALVQQRHLTQSDEDWAAPVLNLAYGAHHVYFIASRGSDPLLNTEAKTITFGSVRDTFWKDYEVSVVSTSNGNRAVMLDRVVTKLRLEFTDAVPDGTGTINITPSQWHYAMNYTTGEPCAAANNQTITITTPASTYGLTGQGANVFGFSTITEWTADIAFNIKDTDGGIIGQTTIKDAPFKRNRVTNYAGPFGSEGTAVLTLNDEWETQYSGVW